MKRFLKKATATALAVAIAATPVLASTPPTHADNLSSVTGVGTVSIEPLQVMIPTSLDFYLDPFMGAGGVSQGGDAVYKLWNMTEQQVIVDWSVAFYSPEDSNATLVTTVPQDQRVNSTYTTNNIAMGIIGADDFALRTNAVPLATFLNDTSLNWRTGAVDATHSQLAFNRSAPATLRGSAEAANAPGVFVSNIRFHFEATDGTDHSDDTIGAFKFLADMHAFGDWTDEDEAVRVRAVVDVLPGAGNGGGRTISGTNMSVEGGAGGMAVVNTALAGAVASRVGLAAPAVSFGTVMPAGAAITRVSDSVVSFTRSRDILPTASFAFPLVALDTEAATTIMSVTGTAAANVTITGTNTAPIITLAAAAELEDRNTPITVVVRDGGVDVTLTFNFTR